MVNTKNNQRFRDTEVRMEAAMLHLLKEREFSKISVSSICKRAEVNRSTFYAHFCDIPEMLSVMEDTLADELLARYASPKGPRNQMFSRDSFIPFLQHIKEHQYFYRIILGTRKAFPLETGYEPLLNMVIRPLCERAGIESEDDILYYLTYFEAGFSVILKRWLDQGCKKSEEEFASTITNCIPAILSPKTQASSAGKPPKQQARNGQGPQNE
ncbi:TetR family transcriptional regulator [Bombiscardovia nodaiensis]|uniref:TetR family transcriptional regulator n=1 Tax=Bombiscardovia nodaiensis TaxID=2932181 RepID=A0ABN6SEQ8_9BIFI|nr:TetR family transcriptional regulator [Bombiscardovia nodaiensis]